MGEAQETEWMAGKFQTTPKRKIESILEKWMQKFNEIASESEAKNVNKIIPASEHDKTGKADSKMTIRNRTREYH